ncbi:MAG: hypothetical protein H6619_06595 [Deltaproteobacteria bacterium]|nr:hypothetical protein [Deltaproteobacteria bacterium]
MRTSEYYEIEQDQRRIAKVLNRLESRLEEDSAASIQFEDVAFQLADLRERIEQLHSKRSRSDNVYFWMIVMLTFTTLLAVAYIATQLMVGSTVL